MFIIILQKKFIFSMKQNKNRNSFSIHSLIFFFTVFLKLQGSFILPFSNYKAQVKSNLLAVFQIQNPSSNCLMGTQSILVKLHQHNLQRRPSFIPCMLVSFSKIYIYFNVLLLCRLWLQSRTSNHNVWDYDPS